MFYPAHINLQDRKCLVVGGGSVAERKVVTMLLSGGNVTLVSPNATELLTFLANTSKIRWHKRQLKAGDTRGYFLVCAATDCTDINTAVFAEAHEKHKIRLVNVVDVIPQCTFAAASVVTAGELMISISTSGRSPATSRRIREHFETVLQASSVYTLGYEDDKPVSIENQRLPYPVYLLLKNRTCVVLCDQKTPEIEHRLFLLSECGATVLCTATDGVKPLYLEEAFLVITDTSSSIDTPCRQENAFLQEYLDAPSAGTHFTPNLVLDSNLIISVSARDNTGNDKAKQLHKKLLNQFENNGYGDFIEFLGVRRSEILKTLPTPKKRAVFFEHLINSVARANLPPQMCCLRLTNPDCSAECLFNWIRQGRLDEANGFTSALLAVHATIG